MTCIHLYVHTCPHVSLLYCSCYAAAADDDAMLMHIYDIPAHLINLAMEPLSPMNTYTMPQPSASELAIWAAIIYHHISFSRAVRLCPIELQLYIRVVIYVTMTSAYHHHQHAMTRLIPSRNIKYATVLLQVLYSLCQ